MERIEIRELRQHASRYVALVKQGQTVQVTERGELVALLVSPHPSVTARERLIADGLLLAAPNRGHGLPEPLPGANGPSNADLLALEQDQRL